MSLSQSDWYIIAIVAVFIVIVGAMMFYYEKKLREGEPGEWVVNEDYVEQLTNERTYLADEVVNAAATWAGATQEEQMTGVATTDDESIFTVTTPVHTIRMVFYWKSKTYHVHYFLTEEPSYSWKTTFSFRGQKMDTAALTAWLDGCLAKYYKSTLDYLDVVIEALNTEGEALKDLTSTDPKLLMPILAAKLIDYCGRDKKHRSTALMEATTMAVVGAMRDKTTAALLLANLRQLSPAYYNEILASVDKSKLPAAPEQGPVEEENSSAN